MRAFWLLLVFTCAGFGQETHVYRENGDVKLSLSAVVDKFLVSLGWLK